MFKYSGEEGYRHLGALIEDMHDQFRAFGDNLSFVREKGDAVFEEVGKIKVELMEMNIEHDVIRQNQESIEKRIISIEKIYTNAPAWTGDVKTYTFDDSKLRELGYKPKYDSKEAVLMTAKELVNNPAAAIAI